MANIFWARSLPAVKEKRRIDQTVRAATRLERNRTPRTVHPRKIMKERGETNPNR